MDKSAIFQQLFSFSWPSNKVKVQYALSCTGYIGNDGYYGVHYESDLDEYDREVLGEYIPVGHVEVLYWDGEHKSIYVTELEYLTELKNFLKQAGDLQSLAMLKST